jgi:hypothetical protein
MDSYKHSCPYCGQHIEYTVEYCGKQMACPSCGQTVVFPAVPPGGKRLPLRLKRADVARSSNWFSKFRDFKHWNIVLACLVPFLIVGVLLAGAAALKQQFGNAPMAAPAAAPITADPNAWQRMTDLARAEQSVQQQIVAVNRDTVAVKLQEQALRNLQIYYNGKTMDDTTRAGVQRQENAATQAVRNAQAVLGSARQYFETAFRKYQQLGGTIDYRQQLIR